MIKISGLPVQVTKADLDELFSQYGTIQITEDSVTVRIGEERSTAFVILDSEENESLAIERLNGQTFRGNRLRLDKPLGGGNVIVGPGSGGGGNQGNDK